MRQNVNVARLGIRHTIRRENKERYSICPSLTTGMFSPICRGRKNLPATILMNFKSFRHKKDESTKLSPTSSFVLAKTADDTTCTDTGIRDKNSPALTSATLRRSVRATNQWETARHRCMTFILTSFSPLYDVHSDVIFIARSFWRHFHSK